MPVKVFYNEFVFQTRAINHEKLKTTLLPAVEKNLQNTENAQKPHWLCEINTEFFDPAPDTTKYLPLITEEIYPALDRLFDALPELNKPSNSTVIGVWYNRYEPGCTQEIHTHSKSKGSTPTISGVYILELNEPNPLVFFSPEAASNLLVSESMKTADVCEGDILLFPASLPHYVLPCKHRRTTIAFNVSCSFA